jgi:hypothetical protein
MLLIDGRRRPQTDVTINQEIMSLITFQFTITREFFSLPLPAPSLLTHLKIWI